MSQKITRTRRGDRLSAGYMNQIVDAANLAITTLDGPRSKLTPATSSADAETDPQGNGELDGVGNEIFTEQSRSTSTVKISDPNDPDTYVEVERIERLEMTSANRRLTLVFDNP